MNILQSVLWDIRYFFTQCRCKGNPAKCKHDKHGLITSFGSVRDLSGRVVHSNADPSWQCSGCGLPMHPVAGWPM